MGKIKKNKAHWSDTPEMVIKKYLKSGVELKNAGLGNPIITTGKPTDGKLTVSILQKQTK